MKTKKNKPKLLFRLFNGIGEKLPKVKSFFTCLLFILCIAVSDAFCLRLVKPFSPTLAVLLSSFLSCFFFIPVVLICYTKNIFPSYKESLSENEEKDKASEKEDSIIISSLNQRPLVRRIYKLGLWEEERSGQVCFREPIGGQREQKFLRFGKRYRQEMLVVLDYKALTTCGIDLEKVCVKKSGDNSLVVYGIEAQSISDPVIEANMTFGEVREISYEKESTGNITKVVSRYTKENENLLLKKRDFYVNRFKKEFALTFDEEIKKSRKEFVESFIRAEFGPKYKVEFENEAQPLNALPFNDFLRSEHGFVAGEIESD